MSVQLSLDKYFKTKGKSATFSKSMNDLSKKTLKKTNKTKANKSFNLSLTKSPTPAKIKDEPEEEEIKPEIQVITVSSDEDDFCTPKAQKFTATILDLPLCTPKKEIKLEPNTDYSESYALTPNSTASLQTPVKIKEEPGEEESKPEIQVVNVSSDEDNFCTPKALNITAPNLDLPLCTPKKEIKKEANTDSSEGTIIYALTPNSTSSPQTPVKTPRSVLTPKSPGSRGKFYSPVKKRVVTKRTPVKRKLEPEFVPTRYPVIQNDDYARDDKTKALINIIIKYLENESLKQLLSEECQLLLSRCLLVVKPGIRVVCRLYWRKRGWFRAEQMKGVLGIDHKIDDPSLHLMLESLIANDWVVRGSVGQNGGNLTFNDLTAILKSDELKQICKDLKLKIQSKQSAIDALRGYRRQSSIGNFFTGSQQNNDGRVLRIMSQKAGPCYKLSDFARQTLDKLYLLMYLGMNYTIIREKRLEVTVLYHKNKIETYPVIRDMDLDDASVVFENREQFDKYFTAHCIYEDFLVQTNVKEKCDIVTRVFTLYKGISESEMSCYKALPLWLRRYTPANVYIKILEAGVTDLKKPKTQEHYTLAVDILSALINQIGFRQHKKAEWYAEKALILYNMQQFDEAANVVLEGLNSNLPAEAKDSLRPRISKIAKKASEWLWTQLNQHADKETTLEKNLPATHIYKQPMDRTSKRGKVKFETRRDSERVVQEAEEYCISQYIEKGEFTHGLHWEGSIVNTLFFLLFWEVIYSKPRGVVGIFISPYQSYPLDLFTDSFYANRKNVIEERLAIIELCSTEEVLELIKEKWNDRDECELSGINRNVGLENILSVCRCLGPAGTAAICRRLATDYRYSHSGFPDLTLWNVHTCKIRFVEVKTDSDKPSLKQIQWMQYLRRSGLDAEFCYVGAHTTRCKARAS